MGTLCLKLTIMSYPNILTQTPTVKLFHKVSTSLGMNFEEAPPFIAYHTIGFF